MSFVFPLNVWEKDNLSKIESREIDYVTLLFSSHIILEMNTSSRSGTFVEGESLYYSTITFVDGVILGSVFVSGSMSTVYHSLSPILSTPARTRSSLFFRVVTHNTLPHPV